MSCRGARQTARAVPVVPAATFADNSREPAAVVAARGRFGWAGAYDLAVITRAMLAVAEKA